MQLSRTSGVAMKVSQESIALLKNDGLLPLDRAKMKKILVIGPNADSLRRWWEITPGARQPGDGHRWDQVYRCRGC